MKRFSNVYSRVGANHVNPNRTRNEPANIAATLNLPKNMTIEWKEQEL